MDKRQRIAMQRALIREAMGKIEAAIELFGTEDNAVAGDEEGYDDFVDRVAQFKNWIFDESVIA